MPSVCSTKKDFLPKVMVIIVAAFQASFHRGTAKFRSNYAPRHLQVEPANSAISSHYNFDAINSIKCTFSSEILSVYVRSTPQTIDSSSVRISLKDANWFSCVWNCHENSKNNMTEDIMSG